VGPTGRSDGSSCASTSCLLGFLPDANRHSARDRLRDTPVGLIENAAPLCQPVPHGGARLDPICVQELRVSAKALIVVLLVVIVVVGATGGEQSAAAIGSAIGEAINLLQVAWDAMINQS
jgi:hypothetical protein